MDLLPVLGLMLVSAPDVKETAGSEARAAVASCVLPAVLADAGQTPTEFVEGAVGRRVRLQ